MKLSCVSGKAESQRSCSRDSETFKAEHRKHTAAGLPGTGYRTIAEDKSPEKNCPKKFSPL